MSNDQDHIGNVIFRILPGAIIGGGLGLGVCIYIFDESPLFNGDTILIGALIWGTLGYFLGEDFIDWLKENWRWFW